MKRDIDFVTKFMMEYDVVVPLTIVGGTVVLAFGIVIIFFLTKSSYFGFMRNASWCLLTAYLFLSLCATIFFREETAEVRFNLHLFRCYSAIYYKVMAENILNILFFVPIGFLVGFAKKKKNVLLILCLGAGMSVAIEIIQLLSKRGVCNIDDVFHNTLGCLLGYGFYQLCRIIISKNCVKIIHD